MRGGPRNGRQSVAGNDTIQKDEDCPAQEDVCLKSANNVYWCFEHLEDVPKKEQNCSFRKSMEETDNDEVYKRETVN